MKLLDGKSPFANSPSKKKRKKTSPAFRFNHAEILNAYYYYPFLFSSFLFSLLFHLFLSKPNSSKESLQFFIRLVQKEGSQDSLSLSFLLSFQQVLPSIPLYCFFIQNTHYFVSCVV